MYQKKCHHCSNKLTNLKQQLITGLLFVVLPPRSYGKPEAADAVGRLLMMGIMMSETC
jgi:hypothetical protein